jgi:hypothetical protein
MIFFRFEYGGGGTLIGTHPHTGAAASAHRQAQGIQQNRFARPGLASQHIQAWREFQRRLFDQNNIADGQRCEHACLPNL